jgi:hypothetical protein
MLFGVLAAACSLAATGCSGAVDEDHESVGETAAAATVASGCSDWKLYAKRSCLTVDESGGTTTFTGTMEVGSGGRGWYGYVELTGPSGSLAKTATQQAGAPAKVNVTYRTSAHVSGTYCSTDWRWNVYNSSYYVETQYCTTL